MQIKLSTYFQKLQHLFLLLHDLIIRIKYWRKWVIGSGLFVILLIFLCQDDHPSAIVRNDWVKVKKGPFVVDLVESGEVEALSKRTVSTPMMWASNMQIIGLVPEGTFVEEGDFLVQFDASDLEERYELNEERIASLKADLQRILAQQKRRISELESNLVLAEYTQEQAQLTMESQKYESEANKEEARIQLKQAEISLKTTREMLDAQRIIDKSEVIRTQTSIRQAENDQELTKQRIDMLRLSAPARGMVVYEEVGQYNSRERLRVGYTGRPGEALITIPDLAEMQVKTFVNEVDRAKVQPGQSADISLDAYPDLMFSGEVSDVARLAQMLENEDNLKGFAVYVRIHGADDRLKPGMTAKVRIHLKTYEDVIAVPLGTVYEVDGQPVVFKGRGRSRTPVQLGERNEGSVIVTEGLKTGDRISWTTQDEGVQILGTRDEQRRIQDLAVTLRRSFGEFESRGILFDYLNQVSSDHDQQVDGDLPSQDFPGGTPDMQPPQDVDREVMRERMRQSGAVPRQQFDRGEGSRPGMSPPQGVEPMRRQEGGGPPQNIDWETMRQRMQESGRGESSSGQPQRRWPGQRGGQRNDRRPAESINQESGPNSMPSQDRRPDELPQSKQAPESNHNTE